MNSLQASLKENFAHFSYLIFYQMCMVAQVAMPCYFGNEITIQHERLTGCIFNCGWHLHSTRYGQVAIIFMEIAKRKLTFLAGNWIVLDLDLFVSVIC